MIMIGKGRNEWGGWGQEVEGALQAKVKAWGGGGGPKRVVSSSCSFATNLIAHFVLFTSHCWWVSISSPSSFFQFFLRW